jgi:hypothetical protein
MTTKPETSEEVSSFDLWKEREAGGLDPLLEKLECEDKHLIRSLLIDAYYAGVSNGIDRAYNKMNERDEA